MLFIFTCDALSVVNQLGLNRNQEMIRKLGCQMEEIHNWEFHFSCWHILLFSISKHGWNGRRISCREHLTGVWDYFSISTANMMNSRIRRKRISCQEKQEGVHVAHPLAVALWIKLARKKSFWSPNTKPWRQMVTTSGILIKGFTFQECNVNAKNINWLNFCRIWHCHHVCVFSGWYPFVEFCVNVGNYGGKSVIIKWLNFCRIWHCNQICVFSVWYPFVEFYINVGKLGGKSVKLHNLVQKI